MAKNKMSAAEANESLNGLVVSGNGPVTWEEAFNIVEDADVNSMVDLSSEYFTFEVEGETHTFAVMGFDVITIKNKPVEVVKLKNKEGKSLVNGDKVMVSSCKRIESALPVFVKVTYIKDVDTKQGTYKDLQVKTF